MASSLIIFLFLSLVSSCSADENARQALERALTAIDASLHIAAYFGAPDQREDAGLEDCLTLLHRSRGLVSSSRFENLHMSNASMSVRHWVSAALTYHSDCVAFVGDSSLTNQIREDSIPLLSAALSEVAALSPSGAGGNNESEVHQAAETGDDFTESLISMASAVVSKDRRYGTHFFVQDAVDEAPDNLPLGARHVIYIAEGTYDETVIVPSNKRFITFVGAGMNRTILTGNRSVSQHFTTFRTATLAVEGTGFIASDLTVINTAGPGSQAVAIRVDSDMSAFFRCSFWGFEDTLYTHAFRQFYKNCIILGTVDFIFGNAASVFQDCQIEIRPSLPFLTTTTITAQGRIDPVQNSAFVCQGCVIRGTVEYYQEIEDKPQYYHAYLGRPWKPFARAIFIDTYMDGIVDKAGWVPWNISSPTEGLSANTTFAEYRSYGPGGSFTGRCSWSKQLNPYTVRQFTVRELIQGGFWLPFTAIPYRIDY